MTLDEVMQSLAAVGNESTKKVWARHGAREPFYGVKVQDLKVLQKRIKKDHDLALALFDTGNSDAMYLAALIADPPKMTRAQLQQWAEKAYWYMLSEYPVAWVTSESEYAWQLGCEWIESSHENIATAGWSTLADLAAITPDSELNIAAYEQLLERIKTTIHQAPNRVRYTMNGFVIAVGVYISALYPIALQTAAAIGVVKVDMGDTACKVPLASAYIEKVVGMGKLGKKRKSGRC